MMPRIQLYVLYPLSLRVLLGQDFLRASFVTSFFQVISIFPRKISSFSLGKIEIPWKIGVPKPALNVLGLNL
jgi:hypothetical protein